jgi:hypothetical protein
MALSRAEGREVKARTISKLFDLFDVAQQNGLLNGKPQTI